MNNAELRDELGKAIAICKKIIDAGDGGLDLLEDVTIASQNFRFHLVQMEIEDANAERVKLENWNNGGPRI